MEVSGPYDGVVDIMSATMAVLLRLSNYIFYTLKAPEATQNMYVECYDISIKKVVGSSPVR